MMYKLATNDEVLQCLWEFAIVTSCKMTCDNRILIDWIIIITNVVSYR